MKTPTTKLATRRIAASLAFATAVAASATLPTWADTTATYTTGDTSLADGKVAFAPSWVPTMSTKSVSSPTKVSIPLRFWWPSC